MERARPPKKPDLILTSDWHLREDTPTCFTGDWHQEQWKAVEIIRSLQQQYKCPVIHAGDLFHHWKPSPALISQALWFLPDQFYTIYGQHDLPQHSWELRSKSGLHTLEVAGKIKVLDGVHYGQQPDLDYYAETEITGFTKRILVWHHLTYITAPYPGATGGNAIEILRKYPQFSLICTGDNHQAFTIDFEGRRLVNPGPITRQDAAHIDFKPRVYLWYAEENLVKPVFLPISDNTMTREHIDVKSEKSERIEAFISHLKDDWNTSGEIGMSFEENLRIFFDTNDADEEIKNIVYKAIG
jgi:predicted phosphodiesterase